MRSSTTVKSGQADAGLIIHEGQLTYARSGFTKIVDLGEWWKRETALPLPLGGNVLRKDIPLEVRRDLLAIMQESIEYGLAHREAGVQSLHALRARHGCGARERIHRHVCERLHARLRRKRPGRDPRISRRAEAQGYLDRKVELEFVE